MQNDCSRKRKLTETLLEYSREQFQLANNPSELVEKISREQHTIIIEEPSLFRLVCIIKHRKYPIFEKSIMTIIFSYLSWAHRSLVFQQFPATQKWVTWNFVQNNVGSTRYEDLCPLWSRHMYLKDVNAEEEFYVCEASDAEMNLIKNSEKRNLFQNLRRARNGMMLESRAGGVHPLTNPGRWSKLVWGYLIRGLFERRDVVNLSHVVKQYELELHRKEVLEEVRFWWMQKESLDPEGLECLALIVPFVCRSTKVEACDALSDIADDETIAKRIQDIFSGKRVYTV